MTGIAVFIIFILFNFLGRFIPSEEEKKAEDYKKAAEMAGCTWQELVTYDTVRYENNLKNVNPYLSAVDFVKMYYEIYNYVETENGGYWALVSGGTLSDSSSIWSWFGLDSGSDLNAVLKASKKYQKPEFVIRFSPKELNDLLRVAWMKCWDLPMRCLIILNQQSRDILHGLHRLCTLLLQNLHQRENIRYSELQERITE